MYVMGYENKAYKWILQVYMNILCWYMFYGI